MFSFLQKLFKDFHTFGKSYIFLTHVLKVICKEKIYLCNIIQGHRKVSDPPNIFS